MLNADEEILQDFLTEAGEILELLSEQLVDLENRPDDADLLNAIFRGFHTVKGGAGFLQLTELVETCHVAENVFDTLRNGKRHVTPDLMDVVLQALDTINLQFSQVRDREEMTAANETLIRALTLLAEPEGAVPEVSAPVEPEVPVSAAVEPAIDSDHAISDEHFEELVSALQEEAEPVMAEPEGAVDFAAGAAAGDEITEEEFEELLNQLHGSGAIKGPAPADAAVDEAPAAPAPENSAPSAGTSSGADDHITEDEFEALLDQLHGKGHGPGGAAPAKSEEVRPPEQKLAASAPAPVSPAAKPLADSSEPKPAAAAKAPPVPPARESKQPAAETTVRVDTARLDEIMNMVGELVLVRNRLVRLGLASGDEAMSKAVANLDVVTGDLQMSVMKTRMQPIKKVFGRFPRVVRDMARNLKKEIKLELVGEETDLDKNLVEALADPLVHLVRNAVDHGVEMPEEREQAGKPRQGNVVLSAQQEGDHILLSISDDGYGMDPEKLRAKVVEKGLMDQDAADRLTDKECYNLIFMPGFSTKVEISDISGRGVGMDVVKTKINQLNGSIDIYSKQGEGTRINIKVPLTLAIMPTLMVMLEDQAFAFPLVNVSEIFHLDLTKSNIVDGQEVIIVRDKAIPLFYLKRWLLKDAKKIKEALPLEEDPIQLEAPAAVMREEHPREGHVVIVTIGSQRVGFVVDQLVGQEEVVIKPLGRMLQGTPGMAGATITGDGRIALILDVPSMLQKYARKLATHAA